MHILRRLSVTYIVSTILIISIYFMIYKQYWYTIVFDLDWERAEKTNKLFIFALFYFFLLFQLIYLSKNHITEIYLRNTKKMLVPLFAYFMFGILMLILHEESFDAIKKYLFYLFTPVMVSLSIFGIYRNNENIRTTLLILFVLGIIFSVYSTLFHIMLPYGIIMSDFYTIHNSYYVNAGLSTEKTYLERFSIPGMGPNDFPSMLVPLVLAGIYFSKNSNGKTKFIFMGATIFLFYNIILTSSRSAFLSLTVGILYLFKKKWLRFNKRNFLIFLIFSIIVFVNKGTMLRLILTIAEIMPSINNWAIITPLIDEAFWGGYAISSLDMPEKRFLYMEDTLRYIIANPIFGSGFTYYTDTHSAIFAGSGGHSIYLTIFAAGGLLVLLPILTLLLVLYFSSNKIVLNRLYCDKNSKDMGVILTAGLLSYIFDQAFSPGFFHYYWVWIGLTAAWMRNCEAELSKIQRIVKRK